MELRHLRYFLVLGEELHFRKAAKRLGISQPPLSMQIRDLEEEIGVRLFHRTSRRVELTNAGLSFFQDVRSLMESLNQSVYKAKQVQSGMMGRLNIGFIGMVMDGFLATLLRKFKDQYPGTVISLNELSSNDQIEKIKSGEIDIGFLHLHKRKLHGMKTRNVLRSRYLLAVHNGHRFSKRKQVSLGELDGENIIMYPRNIQPFLYDDFMDCFTGAGCKPNISHESDVQKTSLLLAASGMGITFAPAFLKESFNQEIQYIKVKEPLPEIHINAVWNPNKKSAILNKLVQCF
jgi:DNA-binding transcriptional LysR family regulator